MARPWWKRRSCFPLSSWPSSPAGPRCSGEPKCGSATRRRSQSSVRAWSSQGGSFLVSLLALVALGSIFFCASLKLILNAQEELATKARLDICAVRFATSREKFLRDITISNQWVDASVKLIYIARGLMLFPVTAPAALLGSRALLLANQGMTLWQLKEVGAQEFREKTFMRCEPNRFSKRQIFCSATEPILFAALKRDKAIFRDITDVYRWKRKKFGEVICVVASDPLFHTRLELRGDRALEKGDYDDVYKN